MIKRIVGVIKGQIQTWINANEDPAIIFEQSIQEMSKQLENAIQKAGQIKHQRDQLGRQLVQAQRLSHPGASDLEHQYNLLTQHYKNALEAITYLKTELDKMRRDAPTLRASATAASIHKQIQSVTELSPNSAMGRFVQAEERIEQQWASLGVRQELGMVNHSRSFGFVEPLNVEAELAKLRSQTDSLPSAVTQTTTWHNDLLVQPKIPEIPQMPSFK